jgi:hypothetical protein
MNEIILYPVCVKHAVNRETGKRLKTLLNHLTLPLLAGRSLASTGVQGSSVFTSWSVIWLRETVRKSRFSKSISFLQKCLSERLDERGS